MCLEYTWFYRKLLNINIAYYFDWNNPTIKVQNDSENVCGQFTYFWTFKLYYYTALPGSRHFTCRVLNVAIILCYFCGSNLNIKEIFFLLYNLYSFDWFVDRKMVYPSKIINVVIVLLLHATSSISHFKLKCFSVVIM